MGNKTDEKQQSEARRDLRSKSAVERLVMRIWSKLPGGWMCRFWYGNQRITFRRNGWITIDAGRGTVKDMLPITLVSQQLVDAIEKQLVEPGYA